MLKVDDNNKTLVYKHKRDQLSNLPSIGEHGNSKRNLSVFIVSGTFHLTCLCSPIGGKFEN